MGVLVARFVEDWALNRGVFRSSGENVKGVQVAEVSGCQKCLYYLLDLS